MIDKILRSDLTMKIGYWSACLKSFGKNSIVRRTGFWQATATLVCCYCASVFAETLTQSLEEARLKLTGDTSKEWVLVRVERFMGVRTECRQGETYTFHADHTVTYKLCVDGQWEETSETWSLNDIDELDRELVIGENRFILLFRDTEGEEQARLRTRSSDKTVPSVDKILRYELD